MVVAVTESQAVRHGPCSGLGSSSDPESSVAENIRQSLGDTGLSHGLGLVPPQLHLLHHQSNITSTILTYNFDITSSSHLPAGETF